MALFDRKARRLLVPALLAVTSLAGLPQAAVAVPLRATGTDQSAVITLTFSGTITAVDATKIVVYPAVTARTPPFYPVLSTGATNGCTVEPAPGDTYAASANPGVSATIGAGGSTVQVTLTSAMSPGAWAVRILPATAGPPAVAGGVTPDDPGCLPLVITP